MCLCVCVCVCVCMCVMCTYVCMYINTVNASKSFRLVRVCSPTLLYVLYHEAPTKIIGKFHGTHLKTMVVMPPVSCDTKT